MTSILTFTKDNLVLRKVIAEYVYKTFVAVFNLSVCEMIGYALRVVSCYFKKINLRAASYFL